MRIIRRHLSFANVASTLAFVFAMGGGAYAALGPGQGGVIHTCFRKGSGALRVVRPTAPCRSRERALAFNRRGPRGVRGPAGAPGKPGATGKTGKIGATGAGVTAAALAPGTPPCPAGGSRFTSISGTTYACNGSATAGASVNATGSLASSRNVTGVALGTTPGVYCVKLASTPSVGVASVRGDAATPGFAEVLIPARTASCGATGDTSAEVLTFSAPSTPAGLPFEVLFD